MNIATATPPLCVCGCGMPVSRIRGYITTPRWRTYRVGHQNRNGMHPRQTHGGSTKKLPEYRVWKHLTQRCLNPRDSGYKNYGGRGITVCARWIKDFAAFYADMGPRPSDLHSIDRINNDGPYAPENCRWATASQQISNRRPHKRTILITFDGRMMTSREWERTLGFKFATVRERLSRGWPIEHALTKPLNTRFNTRRITSGSKNMSVSEWARELGLPADVIHQRLAAGWPEEKAVTTPKRR